MATNYELAATPIYRQPENATIVVIKKEHGQRYSYEQAGLSGDRTHENQEVLIQAVLDVVKAELDPASAIVQTQAKLEEATHKLAETEAKQTATDEAVKHNQEETDRYGKDYPCGRFKCRSRQDNCLWNQLQGVGRVDSTC